MVLAGCSGTAFLERQTVLPETPKPVAEPQTAVQREHARILAAYGGAYENPKLQPLITGAVEKLVAASERPDLQLQSDDPQFAGDQRLRAADRDSFTSRAD